MSNQTENLDAATTEYTVSGLNVNDLADISIIALGDAPCGNSEAGTADCTAQNCPDITTTIDDLNTTFCETETAVALVGTPTGGTFTINGTENTQFDPLALGVGDYEVIYSYADENNCQYSTLQNVQVLPQPIADFSLSSETICIGESIDFTFIGTASTCLLYTSPSPRDFG